MGHVSLNAFGEIYPLLYQEISKRVHFAYPLKGLHMPDDGNAVGSAEVWPNFAVQESRFNVEGSFRSQAWGINY